MTPHRPREAIKRHDQSGQTIGQHSHLTEMLIMENLQRLNKAVTEAGAEVAGIEHGPEGAERLMIRTPGGLVTVGVPLKGELSGDLENATVAANKIVASAKVLTAGPARYLSLATGQK